MAKVQITMSEKQAYLLKYILENIARLGMSQFDSLEFMLAQLKLMPKNNDIVKDGLKLLRKGYFPELTNCQHFKYYGMTNEQVPEDFKILWSMYEELRYKLAWNKNPKGDISNGEFDDPFLKTSEENINVDIIKD